ncbi:MAG: hypothetical protein KJ709_00255 [Nanoarchaeota archaeon]|nr:hypothetical protein [Nanoarchaeota archaeon]
MAKRRSVKKKAAKSHHFDYHHILPIVAVIGTFLAIFAVGLMVGRNEHGLAGKAAYPISAGGGGGVYDSDGYNIAENCHWSHNIDTDDGTCSKRVTAICGSDFVINGGCFSNLAEPRPEVLESGPTTSHAWQCNFELQRDDGSCFSADHLVAAALCCEP